MCSPERRNTMASFTNQATLTYNGGTVNSNIVTGELVQVLTASKTAAAESYRTGDLVTYVVQLRSTGAAALTGLTVTDTLGTTNFPATGGTVQLTPLTYQAGTLRYFMNGVLQTAPAVTVLANGIRIEGITVPAGGVITLVYTTRVNAFADPSAVGTIENTVTVTGGSLTEAVTAVETPRRRQRQSSASSRPLSRSASATAARSPIRSRSKTTAARMPMPQPASPSRTASTRSCAASPSPITATPGFRPTTPTTRRPVCSGPCPPRSLSRPLRPCRTPRPAFGQSAPARSPCRSPARSDSSQPAADAAGIFLRFPACILQRFMLPCG